MFEFEKGTTTFKVKNGKRVARTSHTLNPVPFTIYDPDPDLAKGWALDRDVKNPGLNTSTTLY